MRFVVGMMWHSCSPDNPSDAGYQALFAMISCGSTPDFEPPTSIHTYKMKKEDKEVMAGMNWRSRRSNYPSGALCYDFRRHHTPDFEPSAYTHTMKKVAKRTYGWNDLAYS